MAMSGLCQPNVIFITEAIRACRGSATLSRGTTPRKRTGAPAALRVRSPERERVRGVARRHGFTIRIFQIRDTKGSLGNGEIRGMVK